MSAPRPPDASPAAGGGPPTGGAAALQVACHLSERWLQFRQREQYQVLDQDLLHVDVMTLDDDGEPYKLCELVIARGDLLRAVAAHGDPPFRTTPVRRSPDAEPRVPRPTRPPPRPSRPPAGEQTELP
jgi:hypothetical protein